MCWRFIGDLRGERLMNAEEVKGDFREETERNKAEMQPLEMGF